MAVSAGGKIAVFLIVLTVVVLAVVYARQSTVSKKDRETFVSAPEESDYETRMQVMRLFETLLKRSATDAEVDRYGAMGSEITILNAILRDNDLLVQQDVATAERQETKTKQEQDQEQELEKEKELEQTEQEKEKEKEQEREQEREQEQAYASSSEPLVTDVPGNLPPPLRPMSRRLGQSMTFSSGPKGDGDVDLSARVCLDKMDTLRRLKAATMELQQLYHLVSMY